MRAETGITRKLENVSQALDSMTTQKDIEQFLSNIDNAQKLNDLVNDTHEAMMDYQVCTSRDPISIVPNICLRLPYSKASTITVVS